MSKFINTSSEICSIKKVSIKHTFYFYRLNNISRYIFGRLNRRLYRRNQSYLT